MTPAKPALSFKELVESSRRDLALETMRSLDEAKSLVLEQNRAQRELTERLEAHGPALVAAVRTYWTSNGSQKERMLIEEEILALLAALDGRGTEGK